ncbi:MAG: VOC family protein [Actinomycetales bacterium]
MRLDHVSYAAEKDGLLATTERLADALGIKPLDGGYHPRFGTRNMVLPLEGLYYLEVVEVLDHPVAAKAVFGQAVRDRSAVGGGWLGWVVSTDNLAPFESRLGRAAVEGNRYRPDGVELRWRQIGLKGLVADPQLPYIVTWDVADGLRPGADKDSHVRIEGIQIAGDPDRVREWLGTDIGEPLRDVHVEWVAPHGQPGVMSVTFETDRGLVTI